MVQTTSQEEIEQAVASDDVTIISVVGKTMEEAAELKQYIPDRVSGLYLAWALPWHEFTVYIGSRGLSSVPWSSSDSCVIIFCLRRMLSRDETLGERDHKGAQRCCRHRCLRS